MQLTPSYCTAVLIALALGACSGEEPTAPPIPGTVRTTIVTTGGDPDSDGYDLVVGSILRRSVGPNETVINDFPAGTHSLAIQRVAENCSVRGPNPRTITVAPNARVDVDIEVVCAATGIEVTARTTGAEYAANHPISVNSQWAGMVAANASVVISRLRPGTYAVSLSLLGDQCRISGSHPLIIEVKTGRVTPVSFDVACVAPTRVEQVAYTDGPLIMTVKTDGTGATTLVAGQSPSWSPNGTQLVFSDLACDYYAYTCTGGLAVIDPETKNVRRLPHAPGSDPAWAPAGDAIAFVDAAGQLMLTTQGASPTLLLLPTPGIRVSSSPSWSPDGQRIVFSCYWPPDIDLCVINRDGTKMERLTSGPVNDGSPAWGPHGRIAFARYAGQYSEIVILDPDGRTTTIATGFDPAWSRDGSRIVFSGADGLFIVDSNGTNLTRLTVGAHRAPAWKP